MSMVLMVLAMNLFAIFVVEPVEVGFPFAVPFGMPVMPFVV